MTDWCGGSGQVKWLTDVMAGDKSNDWLMQWYGNAQCVVLALALSLALALALTDDVVAVGKSNDWLMWWYSNVLCLALELTLTLPLALEIRATWRNFRYLIFLFNIRPTLNEFKLEVLDPIKGQLLAQPRVGASQSQHAVHVLYSTMYDPFNNRTHNRRARSGTWRIVPNGSVARH